MTKTERVLSAAHVYGERYFHPRSLSSTEIMKSAISLGRGLESWLVKVDSRYDSIVVSVVVGPDGHTEVTHHTKSSAA